MCRARSAQPLDDAACISSPEASLEPSASALFKRKNYDEGDKQSETMRRRWGSWLRLAVPEKRLVGVVLIETLSARR